jgi:transposase
VTAGIDWATADHVACVVDSAGQVRARFSAAHDRAGIRKLTGGLRAEGAAEVAIERGEGILVDALLAAGLTVVVITSRQVKNLRSRYGSAGAKDDRFDAFVLADVLRTDRARLRPLVPDAPATLALRAAVRARRDLVRQPGRGLQPAARSPGRLIPGRNQAVRGAGQPDQPGVPNPVRLAGRSRGPGRG